MRVNIKLPSGRLQKRVVQVLRKQQISYVVVNKREYVIGDVNTPVRYSKIYNLKDLYLLRDPKTEKLVGGYGDRLPDSYFDQEQLNKGIEVEYEHTKNKKVAKEIAKDHLVEHPNYYKGLERMEKKLERKEHYFNELLKAVKKYNKDFTRNQLLQLLNNGTSSVFIAILGQPPRSSKARYDAEYMQRLYNQLV